MLPTMRTRGYMPDLFNGFFGLDCLNDLHETMPKINVIENDKEYRVELASAGATKENFTVNLTKDNGLTIKFEKKTDSQKEDKQEKYLRKEFSYSGFERTFLIPEDVDKAKIQAKVDNGVLEITLPKAEKKQEEENTLIEIQ